MRSCTWMNGECQQVGPPPQPAAQFTHNTMWNQQAGPANNSCQTWNTGVRPPQSAHFSFGNGAYPNRQASNWPTSAVPHQAVSSQQQDGGNNYYLAMLNGNLQTSSTNTQSGNHGLLVTNGFQAAAQQDFHQNSMGNRNQSVRAQDGNVVSNLQHCRVQKNLFQNVNGKSTLPVSAYATTATSLPNEQVVCTGTVNRQTAHNHNHRQNGTQHGFSPSVHPPSYGTTVSQLFKNRRMTANSSSSEQILHSMGQRTQQYSSQLNSARNNGGEATSSINTNSCSRQYETSPFLSKTNDPPLNPAADTQQERLSRQMIIARIADDLRKSFRASSDGRPPAYSGTHFVSRVRMTDTNHNMQPVSTVAESYNSNASQSLPLNSGQSVMSRTQHSVDAPPQQGSVPNVHVTATGDGIGVKAANALFQKSYVVGSSSDASQLMQLPETQSSGPNNRERLEILEMLSSAKSNDSSIQSSPGRMGARAVAVVQPLSQESYQVASKHTSPSTINRMGECTATKESSRNVEKLHTSNEKAPFLREGSNLHPENPNPMQSNKSSAAFIDGTFVSSSDSAGLQDLSQKQLCADDTGSELAINMQIDQRVAPTAQQSVTSKVPVSQHGDNDKSENNAALALSSIPTVPFTAARLSKLLQDTEEAEMKLKRDFTNVNSASTLLNMFWDGNCKSLASKLRRGWYKDLITDVTIFCSKHVTLDSVILSQVKHSFGKQLKSHYVLSDNELYSEPPYKSSWLNVNEQLDDIDKEFGVQWSVKRYLYVLESDSQPDQVWTGPSNPAQIGSDASTKVLSQTELQPVDSSEDKQDTTVEATTTQTVSPIKTESVDSSDPHYSFEIRVLPQEEARVIFEKAQSKVPQRMDTDSQPERVMDTSAERELPEVKDVTLSDSKLENTSFCSIEQVCCIDRWKEIIVRSSTPSLCKCLSKNDQSHKDFTDKTLDKEEMAKEGGNQAKGGENVSKQSMTFSQTIDYTQDNNTPHSYSDKEPKCISQINMNSSQTSIILISEDEDLFNSENETPNQMRDSDKDSEQGKLETEEEQTQISATAALQTTFSHSGKHETAKRWRKRLSSGFFPFLKKSEKCKPLVDVDSQRHILDGVSKCRQAFVDATENEPLASNVTTVELTLYGSASKDKCTLIGGGKTLISSPEAESDRGPRPPKVITVNLSPMKRKSSETVPMGEHSVKRRIHEMWSRSFPPPKIRRRRKLKTQKFTYASLAGVNLKKAEKVGPINAEELPARSEIRMWDANTKHYLSLKWRRSLSNRLKHGGKKMKKDAVSLKQPAAQERRLNAENGSHAVMPLQENDVLKFSVLPSTFNFKDGSNGRKETNHPVTDKPDLVEGKDESHTITVTRARGTWCPNLEKKYHPLCSPPAPKTSNLFDTFRKKYMTNHPQPSMDE